MKKTVLPSSVQPLEKKVPHKIRPGAKALIVHEGKILVISERTARGEIIHDFPGGGIEYGESVLDALVREVKEEVGLSVEPVKPVGSWSFMLPWWNTHIICIGYQCRLLGSPAIDFSRNPSEEDIYEAHWYTKDELLAQDILRAEGMSEAVSLVEI